VLDITKDIQCLTTFRRRSGDFMKQIKKSKRPVVLTVNGKAAAVFQDAEAYQHLLDVAASADAGEGCPGTPENKRLRHLLYGQKPHLYRVTYRVGTRRRQVDVLHIRQGARRKFRPSDLA
jgi:prevent-host-death family protein